MNKKIVFQILIIVIGLYLLWILLLPVEIVAAHDGDVLLVRNFPYLKIQQIAWWEANKKMIYAKYDIPHKRSDGYYAVYIQNFGKGYRVGSNTDQNSDLLCFDDFGFIML